MRSPIRGTRARVSARRTCPRARDAYRARRLVARRHAVACVRRDGARGSRDRIGARRGRHAPRRSRELAARARARVAGGLAALGVAPGDAVAVQLPNWRETVVALPRDRAPRRRRGADPADPSRARARASSCDRRGARVALHPGTLSRLRPPRAARRRCARDAARRSRDVIVVRDDAGAAGMRALDDAAPAPRARPAPARRRTRRARRSTRRARPPTRRACCTRTRRCSPRRAASDRCTGSAPATRCSCRRRSRTSRASCTPCWCPRCSARARC